MIQTQYFYSIKKMKKSFLKNLQGNLFSKRVYRFCSDKPPVQGSTIDYEEVNKFDRIEDWWSLTGTQTGLHGYNKIRVDFMKKTILTSGNATTKFKFLSGFDIMDIGCGAGLFSERMARLGGNVIGVDASAKCIQTATDHQK